MAGSRDFVAGPIGAALAWIGPRRSLRAASWFAIGMVLAPQAPHRWTSPPVTGGGRAYAIGEIVGKPRGVTGGVVMALRANSAFRAFSGFLIIYLAFLLKSQPLEGLSTAAMYALVATAAAIGSFLGTALGSRLPARSPEPVIVLLMILETVALAVSALMEYHVVALPRLPGQSAMLALDALLQRDVDEGIRASVFARVERCSSCLFSAVSPGSCSRCGEEPGRSRLRRRCDLDVPILRLRHPRTCPVRRRRSAPTAH
jgi:hypothetical protein